MAVMYNSPLVEIKPENETTTTLFFQKPDNFTYKAGQFITIEFPPEIVPHPHHRKNFSLSSADFEERISITYRHGESPFKKKIQSMTPGQTLPFSGPFGKFVLDENDQTPVIFLTGGIGITPFYAMLKELDHNKKMRKVTMLYSNRTVDEITFHNELDILDKTNADLTIFHTITREISPTSGFSWTGKQGRINDAMIKELIPDFAESLFYIVGPTKMVLDLKDMLPNMGIAPERIHFELFTGY